MKINWGYGLLIFFVIYIGIMATVLIRSFSIDHHLVAKDYYARDLAYQTHFDKINNRQLAKKDIEFSFDEQDQLITLRFTGSAGDEQGIIRFYSPLDPAEDTSISFDRLEEEYLRIPVSHLATGRWKVKVDWNSGGKELFQEFEMYKPAT